MTAYRQHTPSDWLQLLPHVEDLGPMPRARLCSAAITVSTLAGVALVARSGSVGTALCTTVCAALPTLLVASTFWSSGSSMGSTAVGLDGVVRDRERLTSWARVLRAMQTADRHSNARTGPRPFNPVDDRLSAERAARLRSMIELVATHVPRHPAEHEHETSNRPAPAQIGALTDLLALRAQRRDELAAMGDAARSAFREERRARLALPSLTPGALVLAAFELAQCDDRSDRALIAECARRCAWWKTVRALEVLADDAPGLTPLYDVLAHSDPRGT